MDRGLRAAPAACTVLILRIGLMLYPGAAGEVVHFGPLILKVNETSDLTKNTSLPELEVIPVTVPSVEPVSSETIGSWVLETISSREPTSWPHSSEAVLREVLPTLSAQTSVLLTPSPVLLNSMTTETSSIDIFSSGAPEPSAVYRETQFVTTLEDINANTGASDQATTVPQLEMFSSFTRAYWNTEITPSLPAPTEVAHPNLEGQSTMVEESSRGQISAFYYETLFVSSKSMYPVIMPSSTHESQIGTPHLTISEETTSTLTKSLLQSIFSNLGLVTAEDSTTSPGMTPVVTPLQASSEMFPSELLGSSENLLMANEETLSLAPSPVPIVPSTYDHPLIRPSYTVSSDFMHTRPSYTPSSDLVYTHWWSENAGETLTLKPSKPIEESTMVSSKEFLVESSFEVIDSLSASTLVVPLSTTHPWIFDSSIELTNTHEISPSESEAFTVFPSQSLEMQTQLVSSVNSTILAPAVTEPFMFSSEDFESTLSTSAISMSLLDGSVFPPFNTIEAPAFVPAESVMYFSQTMSPPEESWLVSAVDSSILLLPTPEPSSLFSSLPEEVSSRDVSSFVPQDVSSFNVLSDSIFRSSVVELDSSSVVGTINGETMWWQTVNPTSVVSFIPLSISSADWTERSSSVLSELSEMWEVTSTMPSESGVLDTSSFTGATSSILPSASALNTATPALPTSSFASDLTSSAFLEETLETFSLAMGPMTTQLPLSMATSRSNTLETYTSVFSVHAFLTPTFSISSDLSSSPVMSLSSAVNLPTITSPIITLAMSSTMSSPSPLTLVSTITPSSTICVPPSLGVRPSVSLPITTNAPHTSSIGATSTSAESISVISTTFIPTTSPSVAVTHNTQEKTTSQVVTTNTVPRETTTTSSTSARPVTPPSGLTAATYSTTTRPALMCDVSNPEPYLVTAVLSRGSNPQNVTESMKELLTLRFNRSVELEVYSVSEGYSFMVTSGPLVYTAIAVGNALSQSSLVLGVSAPILSLHTALTGLDQRFHVQTVLQFVPQSVDIRRCTFSEQIQKGLSMALYEARRLRQETENFTVQIVNISSSPPRRVVWKAPVTISYAVRDRNGYLNGSDVSDQLRNLSLVEFSFFLGFPVKQIAEPSRYPQLNVSPLLMDSWLRTVLLGVQDPQLRDDSFQMDMERKLAQLIGEATLPKRRWKRASFAGSNAVQVVNVSRLDGSDDPVQLVYFIEDQYGGRLAADKASNLINEVNIQRAAIILGYRLQGVVAQPLNQIAESERQAQNLWIIVGVAVPVLVVMVIIIILYWKLCRTDKLDFQPDTMSNLQQRQKLQAPCVKGFDFAKQHLGQHNKDEILVVHEPPPPVLHGPLKDSTPSENGDIPTPKSKSSSKPNKISRHRGSRVTPSDAGSTASDPSSGKESGEDSSPRPSAPPRETRLRPTGKGDVPVLSSGTEQHSSASIFEHVDRMSRSSEASRRLPNKIQLIAMQPMATPPMHGLSMVEREVESNKINREIQTTLRHKSEIEHHRNKIRLRAKRKGHYEFPLVDVVGMTDTKGRQRMYRRAQMQFDKILDPVLGVPTVFIEPRKSSRTRRSPKQRRRQQGSITPSDADRDRLIATDSDGTYKRPPGVSNSAYVSDPDLPSDNPTPLSDVGKYPGTNQRVPPPAQYVAPQPSIEEVRQTMQSLLDDAFALVAPGGPAVTQAGSTSGQPLVSSTPARPDRGSTSWGSHYPSQGSHFNRFVDFGVTPASAPSLMTRSPGFGSGFLSPGEGTLTESQQMESQYPARMYPEDIPSVARPRPLGSTSGSAQIHQLTQVGIASRMGVQSTELSSNRPVQPSGGSGWSSYYNRDDETPRNVPHRDPSHAHGDQDYGTPQMFPVNRAPSRQPPSHLPPSVCYPSGSAEDLHPGHSSASLIKAIREELLRLSQKQTVVPTYHS